MSSDTQKGAPRWSRYGLKGDPYFVDALEPDEDALYPITLFVGRDEERGKIEPLIRDNDRSATLVHAEGGHGKTTLANRVAHDVEDEAVLVTPEEVQLASDNMSFRFFRDVLSGILSALTDAGHELPEPPADPKDDPDSDYPALLEARRLVQVVRRRSGYSAGGQVAGVGGQSGVDHAYMEPTYEPGTSRQLLTDVAREVGILGYEGILVRVNNLDEMARSHPDKLDTFLGESRDLFKIPGIHYLLLGNLEVRTAIESIPRVRGCFDLPIPLNPFDEEQVLEILEERYDHFARDGDWTPPVSDEVVHRLHRVHYGDLGNILADLGRCVQAVQTIEAEPIGVADALPVLQDVYLSMIGDQLTEELWETIEVMADKQESVRQVDLREDLDLTAPAVNQRFQKLQEADAIELSHREGASKYFRLTSAARFALAGKLQQARAGSSGGYGTETFGTSTFGTGGKGESEAADIPGVLDDALVDNE